MPTSVLPIETRTTPASHPRINTFGRQTTARVTFAITALAVLCTATQVTAATTYYVRLSGNDTHDGRSAINAFRTIGKAISVASSSDTVYVGAGTYSETLTVTRSGTATYPIQFIGDKSGAKTGDAGIVKISGKLTVTSNYIQVQDFQITGTADLVYWHDNLGGLVQSCEIFGTGNGMKLKNSTITIDQCLIRDCGIDGVSMEGTMDADVTRCNILRCVDDGIDFVGTGKLSVAETTIQDCGNNGIEADNSSPGEILIDRCHIQANHNYGITFGNNISSLVNNSLIARNSQAGYSLAGSGDNEYGLITYSTITHNGGQGVRNVGYKWMLLRNNIVTFNGGKAIEDTSAVLKETNVFYGNSSGDAGLVLLTNIIGDPQFVSAAGNDFRLSPGSPAINRGLVSSLLNYIFSLIQGPSLIVDLDGNARPQGAAPDIGAFEALSSSSQTYYVRTDGDDNHTGTSVSQAFRTISKATSVVIPGNTVRIGAGTYREFVSVPLSRSGTLQNPIKFLAETPGTVVWQLPSANHWGIECHADYTTWEGIRFTGQGVADDRLGFYADNLNSLTLRACEFDNLSYGVYTTGCGLTTENSKFHDNSYSLAAYNGGVIIDSCELRKSTYGPWLHRNAYSLVKNSTISENVWAIYVSPKPDGTRQPLGTNSPTIQGCVFDKNQNGVYLHQMDNSDRIVFTNTRFTNLSAWEMNLVECNLTVTNVWRNQFPIDKGVNGILTDHGTLTFDGFQAEGYKSGWGLLANYGNVVVKNSTFRDCATGVGFYYPATLDLRDSNISDNHATGSGGTGLYLWNKADNPLNSTQITNCTINNNGNGAWFGWLNDDTVKLTNTTFNNNTEVGLQFHMSDVKFTSATMGSRWKVANNGNGIVTNYGKALFDGITMADNTGWNAITNYGDVTVRNCTFKGTGNGFSSYYNKSFSAQNSRFSDNKGTWGLGYASNGTYHDGTNWVATSGTDEVLNCPIENNTNGVYLGNVKDNRVRFTNSPIRNNANHGLYADGGELTFNASTMGSQWQITGNGNGITTYYGKFLFDGIEIADNKYWGVLTNFGEITVRNCRFTRNPSGGLQSYFNKSFKADNSKFDQNGTCGVSYSSDGRYYQVVNGVGQWTTGALAGEFTNCVIEKNVNGLSLENSTDGTLKMVTTPIRSNTSSGLYVVSSNVSFTAATMGSNWQLSDNGIGITTYYGKILFDGVEIADNRNWGAQTNYGDVTVRNSRFTRNPQGGFQSYFNKSFKAENCKFDQNPAWGVSYYSDGRYYGYDNGEWKWIGGASVGTFKDCIIEKNGTGMYVESCTDATLSMVNSPIRSNTTTGLHAVSSDLSFTTATIGSKWKLSDNGNGIVTYYGKILFDGVEIADNRNWGALTNYGDVTVRNTNFTRNPQGGLLSYYNKSFLADNSHFDQNRDWGLSYHSDGKYYGFKNGAWGWYAADGPGKITNCTISRNSANGLCVSNVTDSNIDVSNTQISSNGGIGVAFYNSTIKLSPTTKDKWLITGNVHGFHASNSNITVEDFEVTGNSQWGMYTYYSNVTLKNAKFNGNGNGMYWYSEPWQNGWDKKLTVDTCQFNNNTSQYGLLTYYGPVDIKSSQFNGNKGDGLHTIYNKSCSVDGCEMKGNTNWGVAYYVNFANWTAWDYKALFQENVQSLNNCVISGNGNGLYVYNAENRHFTAKQVTIDGNQTSGMYFDECRYTWDTPARDQVVIRNNGNGVTGVGQHLDLTLKSVVAENCHDYGLLGYDGKFRAENCRVTGPNYVGFYSVRTTKTELANCRFDGAPRPDGWGWGSLTYGSSADVRNCVFNGYPNGAYPYTYGDETVTPTPKFFNNTFANLDYWGFQLPNGQSEVRNCIFSGKPGNADGYGMARVSGNLTHSNNLLFGFGAAYYNTTGTHDDVLNNPRFVNASSGDLHLAQGSPAINTGTEAVRGLVDSDLDGNPRPSFKRWELGAYEYLSDAGSVRVLNWSEKKQ